MKRLLILLAMLTVSDTTSAETVNLQILKLNGQPLAGAKVSVVTVKERISETKADQEGRCIVNFPFRFRAVPILEIEFQNELYMERRSTGFQDKSRRNFKTIYVSPGNQPFPFPVHSLNVEKRDSRP